jgi:hypothetical protein
LSWGYDTHVIADFVTHALAHGMQVAGQASAAEGSAA